jgi:hypothetical protein
MLNLVRCDRELSDPSREVIVSSLSMFIDIQERLKANYPQLDINNILQRALEDYDANFSSQDENIKSRLKVISEILVSFT